MSEERQTKDALCLNSSLLSILLPALTLYYINSTFTMIIKSVRYTTFFIIKRK